MDIYCKCGNNTKGIEFWTQGESPYCFNCQTMLQFDKVQEFAGEASFQRAETEARRLQAAGKTIALCDAHTANFFELEYRKKIHGIQTEWVLISCDNLDDLI